MPGSLTLAQTPFWLHGRNHLRVPLLPQPCRPKVMRSGRGQAFPLALSPHPRWQIQGSSQQGWHLPQSDHPPNSREGPEITSRLLVPRGENGRRQAGRWGQLRQANPLWRALRPCQILFQLTGASWRPVCGVSLESSQKLRRGP